MRWQVLVGLALIAGSAWIGRDLMRDSENPWPAYAEPQVSCGTDLSGIHDGIAVKFRYPAGWKVTEKGDPASGIVQTYLSPGDGGAEVTLFLREAESHAAVVTVPSPAGAQPTPAQPAPSRAPRLRDAPASTPDAPPQEAPAAPAPAPPAATEPLERRLTGTDQSLTFDEKRHGNAYLSREEEAGQRVSFSWMAFVWDNDGRMTAISGPKLYHNNWPPRRRRARKINCAFWEVLRTVEAK